MAGDADAPDEVSESTTDRVQPELAEVDETEADDASEADEDVAEADVEAEEEAPAKWRLSNVRLAMVVGLVVVLSLAALTGWVGYQAHESYQADQQRKLYVQVARQGALNLTTINWQSAEADVQRILDSATGIFYDDFQRRSKPFIDIVKKAQSKSEGTITEAGLESVSGDEAQVLVAVKVKTSLAGTAGPETRAWRMRITVVKMGDDAKVSNVQFVP